MRPEHVHYSEVYVADKFSMFRECGCLPKAMDAQPIDYTLFFKNTGKMVAQH